MQGVSGKLSANLSYLFVVVGAVWLGLAFLTESYLLLWPVVAMVVAGGLLRTNPLSNLTSAWAGAAAFMGMVLSGYQAYIATSMVQGQLAEVAWISFGGFAVFAVVHLYLLSAHYYRK